MNRQSFRLRLRAFREMRGSPPDRGFIADLEFLENRSIDAQARMLGAAVRWTIAGGAATLVVWGWIIAEKMT